MPAAFAEIINLVVGLAALSISIFSVWLSLWAFQQTNRLFQDMVRLVTHIEDLSENTHENIRDLIKGAWDSFLEKEHIESLPEIRIQGQRKC